MSLLRPLAAALLAAPAVLAAQVASPGGPVPVELLQARRAAVLKAMPTGVAMIASSVVSGSANFAQASDYRESPDFFYLTGIESPGGRLLLIKSDSASAGEVRLFLPAPPPTRDAWSAARVYADTMAARVTGVPLGQVCAIPAAGGRGGRGGAAPAATPAAPAGQCLGVASRPAATAPATTPPTGMNMPVGAGGRGGAAPVASPVDAVADTIARQLNLATLSRGQLTSAINNARGLKDADEIRRLRRASEISAEAHRAAMLNARPGMWEYEIEAVVEYTFRRRGAERVGYPSIVGSGPNSTILHYDVSRRQSRDGDLVLIDAAAEFGYYTADLTRTFPVNGKFTPRQKQIYELVLGAQQAAIDSVRPGMTMARIQQIARAYLKDNSGTICGERTCDTYLNHGVTHSVGLTVHDVGSFESLRPGFAFTIEPGLYLPEEGIGVRIEDVILVTPTGHDVLTKDAPKTVAAIEALMASGKTKGVDALRP